MKGTSKTKTKQDVNTATVAAVALATGTRIPKGEDLISDPKLKKAFREAKKRVQKKP